MGPAVTSSTFAICLLLAEAVPRTRIGLAVSVALFAGSVIVETGGVISGGGGGKSSAQTVAVESARIRTRSVAINQFRMESFIPFEFCPILGSMDRNRK